MTRADFYRSRDERTVEYGLCDPFETPVAIVVSEQAAESIAGQIAALGAVNMAARIHRGLRLVVPEVPLAVPGIAGESSLHQEAASLVHEIDPYNDLVVARYLKSRELPETTLGIGPVPNVPVSVTADRFVASLGPDLSPFGTAPSTVIGGAAAACLAAAALTQMSFGRLPAPRSISLWDLAEGNEAVGPADRPGPLDLGSVAVIGAGAVASALAYWIRYVGISGDWEFVDGDVVELHNTSRGLGLLARHAGWVDCELGHHQEMKAPVTAKLLGARSFPGWYDDWLAGNPGQPDLVLPLANGPGLRRAIAQRGEPLLIHATTSRMWTAELHRHLAEDDDCIACRLPESQAASFSCSSSPLPDTLAGHDAALPFLSGGAGVLLLAGLTHLQHGRLPGKSANHWQLHLDLGRRTLSSRSWRCESSCTIRRHLPRELRRQLPRGVRWSYLD